MWFGKKTKNAPVTVDERLSHVAFIMDGNGRWAKKRGLPRNAGHVAGAKACRRVFEYCRKIGIKTVTVYAFSTENWNRPAEEVEGLMDLFLSEITDILDDFDNTTTRFVFLGDKGRFSPDLRSKMEELERRSSDRTSGYTLNLAMNYGSRDELVRAVNQLIAEGKTEVTAEDISSHLYTKASPDPDLIVRTGHESRLSNFLLWQASYAELMFIDRFWPDMDGDAIDDIVRNFYQRDRRFGSVK